MPFLPTAFPFLIRAFPGLALSACLAASAMALGSLPLLAHHGFSTLPLAIMLGILAGNLLPGRWHARFAAGIGFSKHWLLRAGIVLYGMRLSVQEIQTVGVAGVLLDVLVVVSTFILACVLGMRWLKLDARTSMLIGVGSAICGAAAVLAAEPVVRGRAEQVSVAVATVVVFGTLAMLAYPLLYQLNLHWGLIPGGEHGFAVYVGASVHEVAQVLAAARTISEAAADTAVITKMVRVMMLAPFLVGLALWLARARQGIADSAPEPATAGINIPWFAFGFIAVVGVNSLLSLPDSLILSINAFDSGLLAMAMAALGIGTRALAIRQAGVKPLLLALALFVWLVLGVGTLRPVPPTAGKSRDKTVW